MREARRKQLHESAPSQALLAAAAIAPESAISAYTQTILAPRLQKLHLSPTRVHAICSDVHERLASALFHWTDEQFRRTLLLLGTEEAQFWQPTDADLEVRALIVVCVRNSLIEELNFAPVGQRQLLRDTAMPALTSEAISFFRNFDLSCTFEPPQRDLFGALPVQSPNAWTCLSTLAHTSAQETDYALQLTETPSLLGPEPLEQPNTRVAVIASGIAPTLDANLRGILGLIAQRAVPVLYVPSFSRLTRNPGKLLSILDHILQHDATLVTLNYALSSRYVARRDPLIRPPHDARESALCPHNPTGLSSKHEDFLRLAS